MCLASSSCGSARIARRLIACVAGYGLVALAACPSASSADALAAVSILPIFMLVSYLGLMMYYRSRGGYKPVEI